MAKKDPSNEDDLRGNLRRERRMEYRTQHGDEFFVLPDNARCSYANRKIKNIESCPILNFDDDGDICCPDLCGYYHEPAIR